MLSASVKGDYEKVLFHDGDQVLGETTGQPWTLPARKLEPGLRVLFAVGVKADGSHLDQMKELTDGFGPSVVIVACSNAHAQADALEMVGKGGRVEFFGGLPKSAPTAVLNTNHLHYKEIVVTGSYSEKMSDFQAAQALIQSGRFPADRIITHTLPLERITEAFPLMESGEALKVSIDPSGAA